MEEKYKTLQHEYSTALARYRRESKWLGYAKLLIVIAILAAVWLLYRRGVSPLPATGLGALLLIAVVLWVRHDRVCSQVDYLDGVLEVVGRDLARLDGSWTDLDDAGEDLVDYGHPYSFDLDIFGKKSLFQFLNCTGTDHGRRRFARDLSEPEYGAEEISARQRAVHELAQKEAFSRDFQYWSGRIREQTPVSQLIGELREGGGFLRNEWLIYLLRCIPWVFTPVALLIFALGPSTLYLTGVVLIGILVLLWIGFALKAYGYTASAGKVKFGLGQYARLFALIEKEQFDSQLLRGIQRSVTTGEHSAAEALEQLDAIVSKLSLRNNFITYIVSNALLLWDIRRALDLQNWKDSYLDEAEGWFAALGELESLLSFSALEHAVTGVHYPSPLETAGRLSVRDMGHPLIPDGERVCNSFRLEGEIAVISGSNMSGKTTFLRTVGINLVLAKCGAGVCAGEMAFSDFRLITSMRIFDDLHQGISTFYAELSKIKAIVDLAEGHDNVMFFIDEIFRGTNSTDRMSGAKAVVNTLFKRRACGFLTTHDLALCHYTDDTQVSNWHFSEQYAHDKLSFDYKIRPGIATTTNGQYLMKMIGITP